MRVSRRTFLTSAAAAPLVSLAARAGEPTAAAAAPGVAIALPDRDQFPFGGVTYLDSGSQHPASRGARAAIERYLEKRSLDPTASSYELPEDAVREKFARLVGADADEVVYVPSTTAAEQMFVRGLGLPAAGEHIVTDTLHFFGSLPMYAELERRGCKVTWLRAKAGRIPLEDVRQALQKKTRLVALSLVSTFNGFEHDLKSVCEAAHAQGALVYADIIHAAGCVPLNLHDTGVDFAACATYKWLMGEFGLGFGYVAKHARDRLTRTEFGYYGLTDFTTHVYPFDTPSEHVVDYAYAPTAEGILAHGTHAHTVIAQLDHSLDYISTLGVERIQSHAHALTEHLKQELPKRGYSVITPAESRAPLVTCAYENARDRLAPRLKEANVKITVGQHRFRATPSVFNSHADIERLLDVLGPA